MALRIPLLKFLLAGLLLVAAAWIVVPVHAVYTAISGPVTIAYGYNGVLAASDDSFVIFTSSVGTENSRLTTIYRAATDSDSPRVLVPHIAEYGIMWLTPDDRYVLYTTGTDATSYSLWRVDVATGERVLLDEGYLLGGGVSSPYLFQISPDSQYAVYARAAEPLGAYREIVAVPIAGGPSVEVTKPDVPEGIVYNLTISPDSRHVAYLWQTTEPENNLLISAPVTGGDSVTLNPAGVRPLEQRYRFTPDGQTVLFEGGVAPTQLYRASVTQGNAVAITNPYYSLSLGEVSPDGQYAIVAVRASETSQDSSLLRVQIENGAITTLDSRIGSIQVVKNAPQGTYLAYAMQIPNESVQLFSVDWRTPSIPKRIGTELEFTGGCGCPTFKFASDGRYIVFPHTSIGIHPRAVSVTRVDGSTPETPLYPGTGIYYFLISDDGSRVFFTTLLEEGETLLSIPIEGGETTVLYQDDDTITQELLVALPQNRLLATIDRESLLVLDDTAPTVQFTGAAYPVAEGDGPVEIPVILNGASVLTTTVDIAITGGTATEGQDYTFTPQTLTFAPGETTQTAMLTLLPDEEADSGETITFEVRSPTGGTLGTPTMLTVTVYDMLHRTYLPLVAR